ADLRQFRGAPPDAELLHPATERARVHVQHARGALRSVDPPAGSLEDRDDVLTLDLVERLRIGRGLFRGDGCPGGTGRNGLWRNLEVRTARQDDGALDHVLELAHVPGPGVGRESPHRFRRHARDRTPDLHGVAGHEVMDEERNVVRTVAEWRELDRGDAPSVVERLAE